MSTSHDNERGANATRSEDDELSMHHEVRRVTEESERATDEPEHQTEAGSRGRDDELGLGGIHIPEELLEDSTPPAKGGRPKLWIAVGAIGIAIVLSFFIYAASTILGKKAPSKSQAFDTASMGAPIDQSRSTKDITSNISSSLTANLPATEGAQNGAPIEKQRSEEGKENAQATFEQSASAGESIVADPVEHRAGESVMVSSSGEDVALTPPPVTEEDKLYDQLLEGMPNDKDGIPTEALKIDQNVIKRQLATGQISVLEKGLITTREELAGMSSQFKQVQGTVSEFQKRLDGALISQAAVGQKVDEVSRQLAESNRSQEAQIRELKTALAAAIKTTEKLEARIDGKPAPDERAKPAAQDKAINTSAQSKPQMAKPAVVLKAAPPAPKTVVAPAPAKPASAGGSSCSASTVSAVWRVKGVNGSSAYVVRTEDGYGLLLREGSELPGFGIVKSFDTGSRAVCTTSGIVRR